LKVHIIFNCDPFGGNFEPWFIYGIHESGDKMAWVPKLVTSLPIFVVFWTF
jgi:hypothetical protein